MAILTLFWLFMPYISNDYTLIHLYFPLVMLLACGSESRSDRLSAWLFALLLIPLDYVYFEAVGLPPGGTSSSVLLYPAIAAALAGVIVVSGLRSRGVSAEPAPEDSFSTGARGELQ